MSTIDQMLEQRSPAEIVASATQTENKRTSFEDRALPLIARSVPVIPLRPETKIAFIEKWEDKASLDENKIHEWGHDYPNANVASVAKAHPGGVWFFEVDRPNYQDVIEQQTGQKMPETFMVGSSPGRGHFYFKQTAASLRMGNRQGKQDGKEVWSARVDNRYVVGPGSIHPATKQPYRIVSDRPIVEAPDWLVQWCINQTNQEKKAGTIQEELIHEGSRNSTITSILGKAREQNQLGYDALLALAHQHNQRCVPPLSDSELQTIAGSIAKYEVKQAPPVILGGKIVGEQQTPTIEQIELPKIDEFKYPVFPSWVMAGCSMYDGYIKSVCDVNSRYPEMMFVPGMALLLNYLGTKIRIGQLGKIDGAMVNIIGRKGRVMKSSSVQDMFDYFQFIGILDHHNQGIRLAEGKSLIWTAGSTEGVGVSAQRSNCRNMVLYFDELKTLSDKAGIEGSSMGGHLLSMLQSGKFANETKSPKGNFSFDPGTYSASVISCCTDRMFTKYWSKLIAFSDGLEDRATLILQPENLKDVTPRVYVAPTTEQIEREKQLITKALSQKNYEYEDDTALAEFGKKHGARSMARAGEWAIGFAVQMGKTTVDGGCIERGIALEKYNIEVKRYLNVREAETKEAVIQNHIVQVLMQNQGKIAISELNKRIRPDRLGTWLWGQSYAGLIKAGITMEIGTGVKGDPKMLVLLQVPERDDD